PPRLPSSYTAFTRDEVFWYPDGNIILVAQGVGFRLYQGLLAQHSAVFQDMFNLPAPAPGSDASQEVDTDGCPVVHITDTASELRSLLSFLIRARRSGRLNDPFEDLTNCIRIAHKYDVQDVFEERMGELMCCYYPDNLVALYKCWKNSGLADTSYTTNAKRAILAVNLAHITNTPSILPSALYVCCQLDADVLLRGRVRRDGVVDTLSHEDLVRCIRGKAMLCTRSVQVCLDVFAPLKNPGCTSKDNRCKSSIMAGRLHSIRSLIPRPPDPICESCVNQLLERHFRICEGLWAELPEILGL
ncbi:hypothetical protein FOMPIDRAFT_1101492, partial [Fomitopsis schrenkii]